MGEKMKKFLQEQSNREAEDILAQINEDPEMADVHAPDEMEEALFAQIEEYEKEKAHYNLSDEDRELIQLGKAYKKQKKRRKYAAVASIAIAGLLFSGVTAMGGPERVVEVVREKILDNERTYVDSQNDRVEETEVASEEEAYAKIEEEFGFVPVKMHYVTNGMKFQKLLMDSDTQYINMLYKDKREKAIIYIILPNYKIGSLGSDIEDVLLEEYVKECEGQNVSIRHYEIQDSDEKRWVIEFKDDGIYYFIQMFDLEKEEVEKIIDNLYFDK